jgi:hypothetical protein
MSMSELAGRDIAVVVVAARVEGAKNCAIFVIVFFVLCSGGSGSAAVVGFCLRRRWQRFCGGGGILS